VSRRRVLLALAAAVAVALAGIVAWRLTRHPEAAAHRAKATPLRPAAAKPPTKTDKVTIKGTLYDQDHPNPVGNVKLVLLGPAGEITQTTAADGSFQFQVAPGRYRAFVRDADWITTGLQDRIRVDDGPRSELAGVLDPHLAPLLIANTDLDHLELTATRGARITGHVYDEDDNPVAGATIRMRQSAGVSSFLRPTLGTDAAISDAGGNYSLLLPAGVYEIQLRHAKFAGALGTGPINLNAGQHEDQPLQAVKGCIVRGKVVAADGKTPSPDGAVEIDDTGGFRFGPRARVDLDGNFEFATTSPGFFRVRAWPWKSAPSNIKEFDCSDGRHYDHVALQLEQHAPDIRGKLVDASGQPVPFTYVDLAPVIPGSATGQQERTDANGDWEVFDVEPGQYRLTAAAEGRGVADLTLLAPKLDVRVQLAGVGRISGTTTQLVDGSIEVAFLQCGNDTTAIDLAPETRIVPVHGGRFTIDAAPACTLHLHARWRDRTTEATAIVEPNATAYITLDLGAPKDKSVRGTVRDMHGAPAPNVPVTALIDEREAATVRTNKDGEFTLTTRSGAQLLARGFGRLGRGTVGQANVPSEQVDIILDTDTIEP
jgi:hypothetical protein